MFWDLIIANSISGFGNETIQVTGLLPNIPYVVEQVALADGKSAVELLITPIPAAFWLAFSGIAVLGRFVKRGVV